MKNEILEIIFVLLTFPVSIPMIIILNRGPLAQGIGKKLPYHPRFINWVWATWSRFFWLPCPICGKNFGGHEWKESLYNTMYSGEGVCPKCVAAAKIRNAELFRSNGICQVEIPK